MAEIAGGELVIVQGYCRGEIDGRAVRVPDPSPDADEGETVPGLVVSEPVAALEQADAPMLLAIAAHTHIKTQRRTTIPDDATGYWAIPAVATNDPDVTFYAGRKITLPDGTTRTIQIPYNATLQTVTSAMAGQVNAALPAPLTVNSQVRAVWFSDAADFTVPSPGGPPAIYTAAQIDSKLTDLLAGTATLAQVDARIAQVVGAAPAALDTIAELAARFQSDEDIVAALTSTVSGKLAKTANLGDLADPPTARTNLGLKALAILDPTGMPSSSTYLRGDGAWATPPSGGGGGGAASLTQTAPKTAAYTAGPSEAVPLDTTAGTFTLTFPTGAAVGAQVGARWVAGTAQPTVSAPSGETIGTSQTISMSLAPGTSSGEFIVWQKWTSTVWLPAGGFKPQSALNALFLPAATVTIPYAATITPDANLGSSGSVTVSAAMAINPPNGGRVGGPYALILTASAAVTVTLNAAITGAFGTTQSFQMASGAVWTVILQREAGAWRCMAQLPPR